MDYYEDDFGDDDVYREYDEYDEKDYDEDDIGEYKTPTDEDLEAYAIEEDEMGIRDDYRIDTGAEWRDFEGDISKSRVGMARAVDVEDDLGTMIVDDKFKKLERMTRTPDDVFRMIAMDTVTKHGINKEVYDDALRIMQLINKHNKRLKYKSPKAIVLALLVFSGSSIDKNKLEKVYNDKVKQENMTKIDLLRYAMFIQNIRKL